MPDELAMERTGRALMEGLADVAHAISNHDGSHIEIEGLRDHDEFSLVRVIGETRGELASIGSGLSEMAWSLRGLPGWTEPPE